MSTSIGKTSLGIGAAAFLTAAGVYFLIGNETPQVVHAACLQTPPVSGSGPEGMVRIDGGAFHMGSENYYPDEGPIREVSVESFWVDRSEVTNDQFAEFVAATNYVTVAERSVQGMPPGSAVFEWPTAEGSGGGWTFVEGATWREPDGPGSSIAGKGHYPVVQVGLEDAEAYAEWKGRRLLTEAEFEFAARSGLDGQTFAWGSELVPDGIYRANNWQGFFPFQDEGLDGYQGIAPVGCFEANAYGLYDMIGNVWEWTADPYTEADAGRVGTLKGGSFLCSPNYCQRYRPAARHPQEVDLGTDHIGFRTALDVSPG